MNIYFPRKVDSQAESLLKEKQALVITGMRRVGKTTLLNHLYGKISSSNKIFLDLEDTLTRKIFSELNYENIKLSLEREGVDFSKKSYIFIDEIQFIPEIPSVIKYLYDKYSVKFVVTGSSSYYIKNHFTESLAGRKFIIELYPLTFQEFLKFKKINKSFVNNFNKKAIKRNTLEPEKYKSLYLEYMKYGGFPDVVLNPKIKLKKEILKDIVNSYFQIDVTTLANFNDISKLRDMLILLTQRIGQKVNITNLANNLKIKRSKVYEYLELLKSTYVINTVSQKSSVDNRVSAENKIYFTDTGLAGILSDFSAGSKLENSVYMNLVYDYELTYYQTKSGGEIDFILNNKIGIEAKESPSSHDFATLQKRAKSARIKQIYLVGLNYSNAKNTIMAWNI